MTAQPLTFRVSESMRSGDVLRSLRGNLGAMAKVEQQIASGRLYERLSDAPLATRRLVAWERWVERDEKYQANIQLANGRLSAAESAMDELGDMIARARDLALQQINDTSTDETRASVAVEIAAILDEAVALGNQQFAERYLFAGSQVGTPPFQRVGSYVSYHGDNQPPEVEIGVGVRFADAVSGAKAFGGLSSELRGRADLDPVLTLSTRLELLHGGRGVALGEIEIRDGSGGGEIIDLTSAKTVEDVVRLINDSGYATAAVNASQNGITIAKGGADLTVLERNGGRTARDLGIAKSNMGTALIGDDLDPMLTKTAALAGLRAGAGIDNSGFVITNGNLSATVTLGGMSTVEDLLNAINASGTATVAELDSDGRGLNIYSTLAGAELRLSENGGTTLSELGLEVPSADLMLTSLNGGTGVPNVGGADFRVTLTSGAELDIEIEHALTLGDIAELINDHPQNGGLLIAEVVDGEDRLRLTDAAGGVQDLTVSALNGSFAAAALGISGTTSTGVLEGTALDPAGIRLNSPFAALVTLHNALLDSDRTMMERSVAMLDSAEAQLLHTRASLGGQVRRLEITERRTEMEIFALEEMSSREGDTDLAEAAVRFQQQETLYQAALRMAARLVQPSLLDFLS
ncbi:MAG: flagellar hook-associated protein FlgL [Planctomycetota bacterium]